jgi:EmrB/QacA subfamily drug resistance transporter
MTAVEKCFFVIGIIISLTMIYIDQAGTAVTLVSMAQDLHLTAVTQHWVINAYLLSLASLLLLAGRTSDYFGYKKIYFIGHIIFVLASLLVGFSVNSWMIILGRVFQGVGASILVTGNITLLSLHFPQSSRGKIIGIVVAAGGVFLTAAPLVAGLFTQYLSWRWLFWINLPLVLVALYFVMKFCPKDPALPEHKRLDIKGLLLIVISLLCFIFAIMQIPAWGISDPTIIVLILISILSFISFIFSQLRNKEPFVDLSIFENKYVVLSNIILITANFTMIAEVFWALWFRRGMGYSPVMTGVALIPAMVPTIFLAPFAGKITDKVGAAIPVFIGTIAAVVGMAWVMFFSQTANYCLLFPGILIYGFAPPLIFTPAMTIAMNAVKPELRGLASGVANTNRQLGSALGLAFMGLIVLTYIQQQPAETSAAITYSHGFFYAMILPVAMSLIGLLAAVFYWVTQTKTDNGS